MIAMLVFPLLLVGAAIGIYVIFGLSGRCVREPVELLEEVRNGGRNSRWQAAVDLARCLSRPESAKRNPAVRAGLLDLLHSEPEPAIEPFLLSALACYRSHDDAAVFERYCRVDHDATTRFHALHAMAGVPGKSAIAAAARVLRQDPDDGIRNLAVGVLASSMRVLDTASGEWVAARHAARLALSDTAVQVRWNAAVLLGTHHDGESTPVLASMLDESEYARHSHVDGVQRQAAMLRALEAAAALEDEALRPYIVRLASSARDGQIRNKAVQVLETPASDTQPR